MSKNVYFNLSHNSINDIYYLSIRHIIGKQFTLQQNSYQGAFAELKRFELIKEKKDFSFCLNEATCLSILSQIIFMSQDFDIEKNLIFSVVFYGEKDMYSIWSECKPGATM